MRKIWSRRDECNIPRHDKGGRARRFVLHATVASIASRDRRFLRHRKIAQSKMSGRARMVWQRARRVQLTRSGRRYTVPSAPTANVWAAFQFLIGGSSLNVVRAISEPSLVRRSERVSNRSFGNQAFQIWLQFSTTRKVSSPLSGRGDSYSLACQTSILFSTFQSEPF